MSKNWMSMIIIALALSMSSWKRYHTAIFRTIALAHEHINDERMHRAKPKATTFECIIYWVSYHVIGELPVQRLRGFETSIGSASLLLSLSGSKMNSWLGTSSTRTPSFAQCCC